MFDEDKQDIQFFLWAESKEGIKRDIYKSFVQIILTIGKARTFETYLPPMYLGAFDKEKIAFIAYDNISPIFYKNDFNWNVTPSNHDSKEFKELYEMVKEQLSEESQIYYYKEDRDEIKRFIKDNFVIGNKEHSKIQVSKANFTAVYLKWLDRVKSTIEIPWDDAKKKGILDADFFLADLLSKDNESIKETLLVLLKRDRYALTREAENEWGARGYLEIRFKDGQEAHKRFWNKYQRPPRKDFWEYILNRRDLLVPQDVRERKGSFFTPKVWVEKSQDYLARVLGDNWQDEYYVWDCCAGTGNMERGLTNKYRVFASTLDKADVDVMHDQIHNGMNLLDSHVFQFDFLNDGFDSDKIPLELKKIIEDEEKRKKLVVYINPPYAEASNSYTISSEVSKHKAGVASNAMYDRYKEKLGRGIREVFAQFLMRIYDELNGCWIGQFSKLKHLQSENFIPFRQQFKAKLHASFIAPANTFDNVKGKFPLGFFIWNTGIHEDFSATISDVYDAKGASLGTKKLFPLPERGVIMNWIRKYYDKNGDRIAYMVRGAADFQNNRIVHITLSPSEIVIKKCINHTITRKNLTANCVYFAVRHCIESTWINDRDQFLNPETETWINDTEFQSDCMVFTLFHNQNHVKSSDGTNHWIPFKESDVEPRDCYESHLMIEHLSNMSFSTLAQNVLGIAKQIYRYYHKHTNSNPNASFYDIKLFFKGEASSGRMNSKSSDETFNSLMKNLAAAQKLLAQKIAKKVFEHGFLLR